MNSEKKKDNKETNENHESKIVEFHGKKIDSEKLEKKVISKSGSCISMILCVLSIFVTIILIFVFFG